MSPNNSPILRKSYSFAVRTVKCHQHLISKNQCYELAKQLLKSGTSVGANVEEAQGGISKKDFIAKLQIAYKEARETHYWLRLFKDTNLLEKNLANSMLEDCEEILRILISILKTSKKQA